MTSRLTIAIAGATGDFGFQVAKAFLLPSLRSRFIDVVILTRAASARTQELVSLGAKLCLYSADKLSESLEGINVLVNAVGSQGHDFKNQLLHAICNSSIQLYFPSEFGVNHYIHDFSHDEWDAKKAHFRLSQQLAPKSLRICRVYAGLFLEDSIGPWFGFATRESRYQAVGSPDQPSSYTSKLDVGKALAILASMPPNDVPAEVQLSGDSKSFNQTAAIMQEHGAGPIQVSSIPLDKYKLEVISSPSSTPERYLRFLMGEGKIDHASRALMNQNELFQGPLGIQTFKSMEDLAKETNGKPWAEVEWKPTSP
ncbi:hypothetical protein CDD81_1259 [Ophiocordyceps australis]|uniref:NmrA-like domain-containing protein n=1 Tax=Ophiocordyceps australis TaxID=1399860 RepID=A0A2C5YEI9_9HYPO|nr:hypothetical protein CDD81_1259 [Ophiocordyceps australis]